MAIFTKQFANADEYEEWLAEASGRVNVLSIENSPVSFGSTAQPRGGPVDSEVPDQRSSRSLRREASCAEPSSGDHRGDFLRPVPLFHFQCV